METNGPIRVLMLTCAWPTPGGPRTTHFVKRQVDYLRAAGVDVDVLHFRGQRNPLNYAKAWREMRRRLAGRRYDLIHAQFGQSGLPALGARLPMVVTLRGSDILGIVGPDGRLARSSRLQTAVSRLVCRAARRVVIVSDHMRPHLPRGVQATVLPSGLDLDHFRPLPREAARRQLGLDPRRAYVLFAGDPASPRKRFHIADAAVRLAGARVPAEMLVAWGVPHGDMPLYMAAADAMVFTSMQEGSPNVVKEALACDLPVVSVAVGDTAERLRGIEGCEVTADDAPETVAAALVRVVERGGRAAARETVLHLDERACTQRLIGVYRDAIERPDLAYVRTEAAHA